MCRFNASDIYQGAGLFEERILDGPEAFLWSE